MQDKAFLPQDIRAEMRQTIDRQVAVAAGIPRHQRVDLVGERLCGVLRMRGDGRVIEYGNRRVFGEINPLGQIGDFVRVR